MIRVFSYLILVKPSGRSSTLQNSEMISCSTTLDCCFTNLGPTAEFLFNFPPLLEWIQSTWDHLVFSLRFPILLTHSISERSPAGHLPNQSDFGWQTRDLRWWPVSTPLYISANQIIDLFQPFTFIFFLLYIVGVAGRVDTFYVHQNV